MGLVVLLVVLAIVLLLVARAWRSVAPTAAGLGAATSPRGEVAPRDLPDLGETRERTDDHAREVQDALAATE
jgi:hypothetical protein